MRLAPRLRCRGPGSDFTLLFEAMAMTLVIHMPVAAAASMLGERFGLAPRLSAADLDNQHLQDNPSKELQPPVI